MAIDSQLARRDRAAAALAAVPPEAVIAVFDAVAHVVRTSSDVWKANATMQAEMNRLAAANATIEQRLALLRELVLDDRLPEAAKLRLIDAICQVVVK